MQPGVEFEYLKLFVDKVASESEVSFGDYLQSDIDVSIKRAFLTPYISKIASEITQDLGLVDEVVRLTISELGLDE